MPPTQMVGTYARSSYKPAVFDTVGNVETVPGDLTQVVSIILGYDVRSIEEPEQAWFWSRSWQSRENEANEDIAAGRISSFDSGDDFLSDLDSDD